MDTATVPGMSIRSSLLGVLGVLVALAGCERKWDFECTAVWTKRTGEEVSREVYNYPQMDSEYAATARCKEEMLESRPKGGKEATCKCVGQDDGPLSGLLGD